MSMVNHPSKLKEPTAERYDFWLKNLEELLKLDEVLTPQQKTEGLDMAAWIFGAKYDEDTDAWIEKGPCRTTRCLAGWATTLPYFQDLGFFIHENDYVVYEPEARAGYEGIRACEELFGPGSYRRVFDYRGDPRPPWDGLMNLVKYHMECLREERDRLKLETGHDPKLS